MPAFDFVVSTLSRLQAKVHDMPLLLAAFTTTVCWTVISYYCGQTRKLKHIPSMTSDLPLLSHIGSFRFLINASGMINKGAKQWPGGLFKVPDLFQWCIVVTGPKHIEDIYKAPHNVLSSARALADNLHVVYTFGHNVREDPYHVPIIRFRLTKAFPLLVPEVYDEVVTAFNEYIPVTEDWQRVNIMDTTMKVVCRASNRIFVGLPLCRNSDYVDLNVQFTASAATNAFIFSMVPGFLRPIVNSLISVVPKSVERGLKHIVPMIQARRQEREKNGFDKQDDLLTWLMDEAKGEEGTDHNLTLRVLTVNFPAIITPAMTFMHTFYYLASFSEYMQPLREEVEEVVKSEGWTKSALDQMHKLDSFIRESQRLHTLLILGLPRLALEDFTFSDGTTIPRGTYLSVSTRNIHTNDKVYEDPLTFDGFRFSKIREESKNNVGMVSTSPDYLGFGHGRQACPGRYFAACELKLMFAHIITTYDVKLENEGVRPPDILAKTSCVPNQSAVVFFRKRAKI